jgi:hypothetical protein
MTKNCKVCGKAYKFCPDCEPTASYKEIVDTPTCYAAWLTVIEYRDKVIDAKKAVNKLKEYGITKNKADNFTDGIKALVLDAYAQGDSESDNKSKVTKNNKRLDN